MFLRMFQYIFGFLRVLETLPHHIKQVNLFSVDLVSRSQEKLGRTREKCSNRKFALRNGKSVSTFQSLYRMTMAKKTLLRVALEGPGIVSDLDLQDDWPHLWITDLL